MSISRRDFITVSAAALAVPTTATALPTRPNSVRVEGNRFDPWIEVDSLAIQHNVRAIAARVGNRPILAVVKNNAYGLGLTTVGPILDRCDEIVELAVVKVDQALALRAAGVTKPILLMGHFDEEIGVELAEHGISLAPFTDEAIRVLPLVAQRTDREISVHLYLDTGMSRLGLGYERAVPWIEQIARLDRVRVKGTFSGLTEEDDFDPEQLSRLLEVAHQAERRGLDLGSLHLASSHALYHRPECFLDMVRPGLVLYGAHPAGAQEAGRAELRPAFRLRARVVRVERLEPGDSVSYGRNYVAERPTWIATLPVGHADGYPREAVNGCEVLVGDRTYPVIGAVSASHTILELGPEATVQVGDVATLLGPDSPEVHPNTVAERAEISVYDVLMHLSAGLPKVIADGSF